MESSTGGSDSGSSSSSGGNGDGGGGSGSSSSSSSKERCEPVCVGYPTMKSFKLISRSCWSDAAGSASVALTTAESESSAVPQSVWFLSTESTSQEEGRILFITTEPTNKIDTLLASINTG